MYHATMHHNASDIYVSVSLDDVTRQYAVKSGSGYTCSICGKARKDFTAMTDHMEAIHFPSEEGYSCVICVKSYKSKHSLACHMSTYHRKNKDWNTLTDSCFRRDFVILSIHSTQSWWKPSVWVFTLWKARQRPRKSAQACWEHPLSGVIHLQMQVL